MVLAYHERSNHVKRIVWTNQNVMRDGEQRRSAQVRSAMNRKEADAPQ